MNDDDVCISLTDTGRTDGQTDGNGKTVSCSAYYGCRYRAIKIKPTSCARGDTWPLSSPVSAPAHRAPPSRRNVAVVSHAQYILTVTAAPASRVKATVSKAAW